MFLFSFQSNRGYDPTLCVLEECGYIHPSAVASALTYATNHGVTMLLLCSTVGANHWLSQLHKVKEGSRSGVCLIKLQFLCDTCASKGETGMCVHGQLKIPFHIDSGGDKAEDPVRQLMEYVAPGTYQTEVCGSNLHTVERDTEVFGQDAITTLTTKNLIDLSAWDQENANAIYIAMDPVQAGSGASGIGLATVLKIDETYAVSIFLICILLAFSLETAL